uniref:Serpin 9 n=1 Tax=Rhipicephalus haemaphysaloides TaxID=237073 RepID=A0A7L7SBD6_RHIHE|nr:serpin 9 [Rhipicephalus haemaphysaloides]
MSSELSAALSAFTVDLYKQVLMECGGTKNVVISPFSITTALSMTLAGAKQHTADEIADVLHVKGDTIHLLFSEFLANVSTYAPDVALNVANRLYLEKSYNILDEFVATLQKYYDTTVVPVDFKSEAEAVRLAINAWVQEVTISKICDLLPFGGVDSDSVLVLINAIYFKGLWDKQFNPEATTLEEFHGPKEAAKKVHMMYKQADFKVNLECGDLNSAAVEVPYKGGKTSMVILLPREVDGLPHLEATLTALKLSDIFTGLRTAVVQLSLPRFKVELSVNIKNVLQSMGIQDLFSRKADLSGISGEKDLVVSAAFHKAFVEVNEEGTEAAAATGMLIRKKKCAIQAIPFVVDHPFIFLIRSHNPDIILFAGSVRDVPIAS